MGGLALLAEASARAAIVLSVPVSEALFLAHAPAVVIVIVLIAISALSSRLQCARRWTTYRPNEPSRSAFGKHQ